MRSRFRPDAPTCQAAVAAGALCAGHVALGVMLGYRAAGAYLACWALALLVLVTAWTLVARAFNPTSFSDAIVRSAVIAFALIVACGLALGAAKRLTLGAVFGVQGACLAATLCLPRRDNAALDIGRPPVPVTVVAIVGAVLAVAVAFAARNAPLTLYDSLSYHLFFAARWLQAHALSIVPTPFSDEAQAYAPANGELFFLWLMLPFHGDLLARFGQLPFAILGAATLYALARRLGAPPRHAAYPPAFFLLARPVLEQAIGADVDLICAVMFLTSLYLLITAIDTNRRRDWALCGVSLGLYWGSKYLALVYTPAVLALALARGPRARMAWALPGIAAFALPWYLRNWVVAGSPIYPATLEVSGLTIATGAFTRQAMLNTAFHTNDPRLLPAMLAHAFGPTLFVLWCPLALLGGLTLLRSGWWPAAALALLPIAMLPLYWFGFPVNVDSRFLLPAIGPALLPLAFVFERNATWNGALHAIYAAGLLWIVAGVHAVIRATLPWFMSGWLSFDGLLRPAFLPWFAGLAALIGAWWLLSARRPRWAIPLTACLCAASTSLLAFGSERWCPPTRCEYLDTTPPYLRSGLVVAWRWTDDHVRDSTIAYTGINLPYPLTGERLTNRVVYANIDGHVRWRFDDYDRAFRDGRFAPFGPLLAVSSGELMPVRQTGLAGPRDDAVRPRYERMEGDYSAWMSNLKRLGVTRLFVSALSAYEAPYVWHNRGYFPIEDEWAKAHPDVFRLIYDTTQVRIYAVHVPNGAVL